MEKDVSYLNASELPYDPYVTHISIDKRIICAGLNKTPTLRGNHKGKSQGLTRTYVA
jgi:hypothetical protein